MNNRSTIQNQPCRNGFTYFILDMHKRKTYQTELFSTCCNEKNKKIFSDLYSLRILIDESWNTSVTSSLIRNDTIRAANQIWIISQKGRGGESTDESVKIGRWDLRCLCSIRLLRVPSMICIWGDAEIAFRIRSLDAVASERAVYISWFAGLSNFFQVSERSRIP